MGAARRRELARVDMATPVECRYHRRDVTTAEMALLRSVSAGPSALSRCPTPDDPNGYVGSWAVGSWALLT